MDQTLKLVPNHNPFDRMLPQGLLGDAFEVHVHIEDKDCLALQDKGSQVTTLSENYYRTHLSHLPLYTCDGEVRVEGAGGDVMPYACYWLNDDKATFVDTEFILVQPKTYTKNFLQ